MTPSRKACAILTVVATALGPAAALAQQPSQPWPKGDAAKGRAAFAKFECSAT